MPTDLKSVQAYNFNYQEWLNKKGLGHSHLEKPAMYSALGKIRGKTILCLGCGAGEECAHLQSLGAKKVIGIDLSNSLITIAKEKFPTLDFQVMDMEKLFFKPNTFDLVYSSLVLHYVKNWKRVLQQVRKVLKRNGIFLFSTHHPAYWSSEKKETSKEKVRLLGSKKNKINHRTKIYGDYLHVRKINDVWYDNFKVTYYHKPFAVMLTEILNSQFQIVACLEPQPLYSAKKINPEFWELYQKLPLFIIFKLKK